MKRSLMPESATIMTAAFIAVCVYCQPIVSFMIPVIMLLVVVYYMDQEVPFFAKVHRLKQLVVMRRWMIYASTFTQQTWEEIKDW